MYRFVSPNVDGLKIKKIKKYNTYLMKFRTQENYVYLVKTSRKTNEINPYKKIYFRILIEPSEYFQKSDSRYTNLYTHHQKGQRKRKRPKNQLAQKTALKGSQPINKINHRLRAFDYKQLSLIPKKEDKEIFYSLD